MTQFIENAWYMAAWSDEVGEAPLSRHIAGNKILMLRMQGGEAASDLEPMLRQMFAQAFDEEDKPIIEAAYSNLEGEDFWGRRPVAPGIDQGGVRARRMIQTQLGREQAARTAEAAAL